jgi:AcrR family transcriptional regulator
MTATRAPRRDATENRSALLAAARAELNLDEDASLEAIAARAGLSRRAVYGHFATRDELVRELITLGSQRISAGVLQVHHDDPVVRLALIAARLWHEVEDVRVMAVFAVRGPLKQHTAAALQPVRESVQQAIAEGVAAGSVRSDIAVPRLARLVEDAALTALVEASRERIAASDVHRLAILLVLGTIGMSATDASAFIDSHTELTWKAR